MSHRNCFSHQELSDYCLGTLKPERADNVADHVEQCPDCESTLRELEAQGDTMFSMLLRLQDDDPYLREPELTQAFELAVAILPGPAPITHATGYSTAPSGPIEAQQLRDYRLVARLGQGGMGTVYKAVHTRLDKLVAVKLLPTDRTRHPHAVARFQREMKAVGKLQHPNIVAAHDAGEVDGRHYLVMEYVEGLDLAEVARRAKPLAVADACELARQAALGLDYAHHHDLVHRDIKPSNLMLCADGHVKILDLGLALLQGEPAAGGELTGTEQLMGTTDYIAPEQATDSHGVDCRADIYSLGCTLWKLLTGVAPYGGPAFATSMQKLLAHVSAPVPRLSDRRTDLPDGLAAVVERMLAKRPEQRFASAADVAAALAPYAAGSDLAALFAAVRDESGAAPSVGNGLRAVPQPPMPDDDVRLASSYSADTDAYLSSAFSATDGGLQLAPEAERPLGQEIKIIGNRGPARPQLLVAAAGAAAVLLLGVIIIVKMRDGSTRRFEVSGDVQSVTTIHTENAEDAPTATNPEREVVKWVYEVDGRVAGISGEAWSWPSKWPEKPSDLPNNFDDLMILLANCQKVTDADLKRFKSLTKPFWLNLYRTGITDAGLAELRDLSNLRRLIIEDTRITRAGIEKLGTLPNLDGINLCGTRVTGADLNLLSQFPKLVFVQLGRDQLTGKGVEALASLKNITSLEIADGVGLDEFTRIGRLGQLRHLAAVGKSCSDSCLEPLSELTNLHALAFYGTSITDAGVARLPSVAPGLAVVTISEGRVTDAGVKHLAALSKLEAVNLYQTQVTATAVAELQAAMPKCRITLTDSDITPRSNTDADRELAKWVLESGGKLQVIESEAWGAGKAIHSATDLPDSFYGLKIDLSDCQALVDADLKRFRSLAKPFSLVVARTRITDAGLAELHGLWNLRRLDVGGTKVTRAGLESLGDLPTLSEIDLIATSTTDEDLSLLSRFPKLEVLAIGRVHLTERGVQALSMQPNIVKLYCDGLAQSHSKSLGNLRQLKEFSAGGSQFGDACLEPLAKLPNLIVLGLHNTSITDEGIAKLPVVAPRLLSLVVSGAPVSDASLEKLSALTTLANLWLNEVKVTDAGLKQLKLLPKLKQLGLNKCHIGDAGLENLGALVGLESLLLCETDVTDEGLPHLYRLTKLKLLDLTNTRITAVAAAELQKALPGCEIQR